MGKSAMPLTGVHIILIILGLDIIQTKNFLVETGDLKKDGAKEDKEEELTNTLSTDPANDYVMYMGKRIEYETETERRRRRNGDETERLETEEDDWSDMLED